MKFEILVAARYLKAKRKQAVISLITVISIAGVAAGVAALVIAMAVSAGLRADLQERLLGAQAHLTVVATDNAGISRYNEVAAEIETVDGVLAAAPYAYQGMMLGDYGKELLVQGIEPEKEKRVSSLAARIVEGNFDDLKGNTIIIGKELAASTGIAIGDQVEVVSLRASATPFGTGPTSIFLTVKAIYSIGLYDYDMRLAYVPLEVAQYLVGAGPVASRIDVKIRDIDAVLDVGKAVVEKLGPGFDFEDWQSRNKTIFQALKLERLGMAIAIGLIVFVAALNIVATLTMMVLEKTRDIATLMAMGATITQVRRIFIYQGLIIGVVGTTLGLALGHAVSYVADKYQLIKLAPDVYTIAYLPLKANGWDSAVIALAAVAISFLATLYPSAAAANLQPVEALRYE